MAQQTLSTQGNVFGTWYYKGAGQVLDQTPAVTVKTIKVDFGNFSIT
ncbi:hypothetical protein SAE02_31930 [Skermanella aerolata]|uniref:Uncharacterized protein n=1 Tax=Skermanella aerolata TaxID=393310 RepID=A0A512DRJ7_9PROT|nr:hypothetical protein [Skermanella aerolata]KJB92589.1 hypothetical protein N826_22395 [Skermanella aerolata KACC 11604]GEO39045.1 hypothetical protein SAE02_31930 [Skermanella aerolata]